MSELSFFRDEDWALVKVEGADRVDFLHRLTTNVLPKTATPLVHNFFLSVNARIQAEFWVSAQPDYLALLTPASQVEALKECIDRYHFGEKIEVVRCPGSLFVVSGLDQESRSLLQTVFEPDPRYGEDCAWCYTEESQALTDHLTRVGRVMEPVEAERRRVHLGRPKAGLDYTDESLFVEIAQQGDFSETKGCYPGQEIVARVLHRGRLNRHLRGFTADTQIPADWHASLDGKEIASVRSTVNTANGGSMGYLMVRREYGEIGETLTGQDEGGTEYTLTVAERAGEIITGEDE